MDESMSDNKDAPLSLPLTQNVLVIVGKLPKAASQGPFFESVYFILNLNEFK